MKFTCLSENLNKGLSTVSKAVPIKSALPVLTNVLLSTHDGRLQLSATNLDMAITTYVGASVVQDGSITIPARILGEFVSHLSPVTLVCHLKGGVLHVDSERAKSKFNGTAATDFPELPAMPQEGAVIELAPKDFAAAVNSVVFSASIDENRPVLTGVFLSLIGDVLTFAGSDGYRLSERVLSVGSTSSDFSVVVPAKTLSEIARVLGASEDPIKMAISPQDNLVLFEGGNVLISSRIIDGNFPDHKKIIPAEHTLSAEFASSDLLEAVKLANVFAKKDAGSVVKLTFDPKGKVSVASAREEVGENNTEFLATVKGDALELSFNSKYLLDLLNNVKAEKLRFETNGGLSACVLKPAGQQEYLHIIMPMRQS
ncbi:MAG: polymerase III subunit beta protein [candidate division WWE3 bacterium GW2011_GWA2_46_9]|uniref:Beta sliding clamp n=1 Tax=candidate division WWE3 bacterium GW2011_GWA2_46_9 TaxID=1619111 RepID=A0A0G1QTP6_UNCKA|nr:MAG: polymerase III subunit beta protein [candidate division WWE3 bacterium GW2011_GWA2_46_9]